MSESSSRSAVLARTLCWGALAGAAVALLLTTTRGREARERLQSKLRRARELAEDGRELAGKAGAHVKRQARHASHAIREGRSALDDIRRRGEHAVEAIGVEIAEAADDARVAYREVRRDVDDVLHPPPRRR